MNILLDFISLQHMGGVGGAASFTKTVADGIIARRDSTLQLFALIDSQKGTNQRFDVYQLCNRYELQPIDIAKLSLKEIIAAYNIDTLFISIAQWFAEYDLSGVTCRTVIFLHDIFDCERNDNRLDLVIRDHRAESRLSYLKRAFNLFSHRWERKATLTYNRLLPLLNSPRTTVCTVSDYSRNALQYYFPSLKNKPEVFWAPLLNVDEPERIENPQLARLIETRKPYILFMQANRRYKNPAKAMEVFRRLSSDYDQLHLLSLKYGRKVAPRHIDIQYLSDSDLQAALRHAALLLFPSFLEGFGYPPVEAMRYSTPVVASNATSIPEIVGDGAELCSPFYTADIYRAVKLVLDNRELYSNKARRRFSAIAERQQRDFQRLISLILQPTNE